MMHTTKRTMTTATLAVAGLAIGWASGALAQTTLDGTSGSATYSGALSTTGGLVLNQGFFVETLIVGGGGSGGAWNGGGGGAGGMIERMGAGASGAFAVTGQSYSIVVGSGGASVYNGVGNPGVASTAFGLTALGGGSGGYEYIAGGAGGSGGGGSRTASANAGGSGQQPGSPSGGDGNVGGNGFTSKYGGGGGGGAGAAGAPADTGGQGGGGNGGAGRASDITGASLFYAGGGGGGGRLVNGIGGSGIGGNGATLVAGAGAANTGSGGGGTKDGKATTGAGGSGIVIVRYAGDSIGADTGGTISSGSGSATGATLHTFTSTGTSAFDMSGVDLDARLGTTITTGITGDGNLTYNGPGKLTLAAANDYTGTTTVSAGTLVLASNGRLDTSAVTVASGAYLELQVSDVFSSLPQLYLGNTSTKVDLLSGTNSEVGGLWFDTVSQAAGTWGATGSGADIINDDYFTGAGTLTVIPEPATLSMLLAGVLAFVARRRLDVC